MVKGPFLKSIKRPSRDRVPSGNVTNEEPACNNEAEAGPGRSIHSGRIGVEAKEALLRRLNVASTCKQATASLKVAS